MQSLFRLYTSMLKDLADPEYYDSFKELKHRTSVIEGKFVFALVWSFGATADTPHRKKI